MNKKKIITELAKFPTDETKAIWMLEHIKQLEEQFETAEDLITDRCEKIIKDVFKEDIGLNKDLTRWAAIGMKYENFVQALKSRISIDEMVIDKEVTELLKMAKHEILELRKSINKQKRENSIIKKDIQLMETGIYAYEKINLLENDKMKKTAKSLCESDGRLSKYKVDEIIKEVKRNG